MSTTSIPMWAVPLFCLQAIWVPPGTARPLRKLTS
nr:MAG TPA: hypothetical protein [Caudoviricetes sp.]